MCVRRVFDIGVGLSNWIVCLFCVHIPPHPAHSCPPVPFSTAFPPTLQISSSCKLPIIIAIVLQLNWRVAHERPRYTFAKNRAASFSMNNARCRGILLNFSWLIRMAWAHCMRWATAHTHTHNGHHIESNRPFVWIWCGACARSVRGRTTFNTNHMFIIF